ncbi:MAG: DNA cytosine methyltransferase [Alphaproteobacteria bacterium]|nr:MAG: DNA cytosine methyltransferase [Alphaproteobacteria bacterium]
MSDIKIIDLFSGCGGFSLGAHLAGFKSILAVDIDKTLSSSYSLNFPNSKLFHANLASVRTETLLKQIDNQKVFGLIGGPPCQGFSMMGKRDANDPRNELIRHYFRHVMNIQPAFFVMENVPGLLSGAMRKKLETQLKTVSEDYTIIGPVTLSASQLGAPTSRERVVVIGYDSRQFHSFSDADILKLAAEKNPTVEDAINDLPLPVDCDEDNYGWAKIDGRRKVSAYAAEARLPPPADCGWKMALDKLNKGFISGFMNTVHSSEIQKRYNKIKQGQRDEISKAVKLKWDGQCPTLRAGTGSDKGSYQAVRPLHPEQGRVITVREAARLQGFPDWFTFHSTKWHSFRMIGNSVSPYLSKGVLQFIKKKIKENAKNISSPRAEVISSSPKKRKANNLCA